VTFTSIRNEIADRVNITSAEGLARIGRTINERYGWILGSIGMQVLSQRVGVPAQSVIGSREMTFDLDKIQRVYDNTNPDNPNTLDEVTMMEMRDRTVITQPPQTYARLRSGARTETIYLDCVPTSVFTLTADGLSKKPHLQDEMVPAFPEDFHDILIYYGLDVEYRKKMQKQEADDVMQIAERRMSELRMYLAKNSMLNIYQNKRGRGQFVPIVPQ